MHAFLIKRLWLLAALLALIVLALLLTTVPLAGTPPTTPAAIHQSLGDKIRLGLVSPPSISTTTEQKLELHHSFQALVSYTDQGFEPKDVTIKAGQTVRFTNNSSGKLWVGATSANGSIYPSDSATLCGASSLDSCLPPVAPQDFWEVTLTQRGDWQYTNLIGNTSAGIVKIQ